MTDPVLAVNFDGNPQLTFTQGDDRTILVGIINSLTQLPVNLTSGVVGINLPLQGGGSIKRTSGTVPVPYSAVVITPASQVLLTDHGFVTGDPVTLTVQAGGTLPGGLAISTNYLIKVLDVNTFQFTDTSGNIISLTSQGTIGFSIFNANDVVLQSGDLGQFQLNLRDLVSAQVNAALAQSLEVVYTLSGKTRIALVQNLLDVYAQVNS